jgi:hypothetical protein
MAPMVRLLYYNAGGSPMQKTWMQTETRTLWSGPRVALLIHHNYVAELPDDAGRLTRQVATTLAA